MFGERVLQFLLNPVSCFGLDSGLSVLTSLVKLQTLNLATCTKLTDSCLQYITGQTSELAPLGCHIYHIINLIHSHVKA